MVCNEYNTTLLAKASCYVWWVIAFLSISFQTIIDAPVIQDSPLSRIFQKSKNRIVRLLKLNTKPVLPLINCIRITLDFPLRLSLSDPVSHSYPSAQIRLILRECWTRHVDKQWGGVRERYAWNLDIGRFLFCRMVTYRWRQILPSYMIRTNVCNMQVICCSDFAYGIVPW